MKDERIILAGFGGQGVMLMGQLLAQAGMDEGRFVTWLPSYGPEMRGGRANCDVIISDAEIASPKVHNDADTCIIMNVPSMEFVHEVVPGGVAIINTSLVDTKVERDDIKAFYVPATELASEVGNLKTSNMVMLGAYVAATGALDPESVLGAMEHKLGARKAHLMGVNRQAFEAGAKVVADQSAPLPA